MLQLKRVPQVLTNLKLQNENKKKRKGSKVNRKLSVNHFENQKDLKGKAAALRVFSESSQSLLRVFDTDPWDVSSNPLKTNGR
ncbi:hypothetical protein M0802_011666 [Mischocyttarus mexicanus]|nr:hypothetical protein M0802_011666 [Mischocyttarus mexicanus]